MDILITENIESRIYWLESQISNNENRLKYAQMSTNEQSMLRADIRIHQAEIKELKLQLQNER